MATLKEVSKEIMNDLERLGKNSQLSRFVASNLHTLTLDRIFTQGKSGSGSSIGSYASGTIKKKKKEGRFTSNKVNLRNTEQLVGSYIFNCSNGVCELGFAAISRNDKTTNTEVKKSLERQYGDDLFNLTSQEEKEVDNLIEDYLDKVF